MTIFCSATENESAYEMLSMPWNSKEYPNVFVLQVSATPWNLQTVQTRIENTEVIQNSTTDEISVLDNASRDRYRREKFKLNEVQWINSHESDLKRGKECRLVVSIHSTILNSKAKKIDNPPRHLQSIIPKNNRLFANYSGK